MKITKYKKSTPEATKYYKKIVEVLQILKDITDMK